MNTFKVGDQAVEAADAFQAALAVARKIAVAKHGPEGVADSNLIVRHHPAPGKILCLAHIGRRPGGTPMAASDSEFVCVSDEYIDLVVGICPLAAEPGPAKADTRPEVPAAGKMTQAEHCGEVARKYTPPGVTVKYRKSISGCAWYGKKLMEVPRPVTPASLEVHLHESAHFHLEHYKRNKPTHLKECEAEEWALARMRDEGVRVPRKVLQRAKRYVARKIVQAQRRGAKHIDRRAMRFAGLRDGAGRRGGRRAVLAIAARKLKESRGEQDAER